MAGCGAVGGDPTGVVRKQAGYLLAFSCMVCFMVVTTRPGRRPPAQQPRAAGGAVSGRVRGRRR